MGPFALLGLALLLVMSLSGGAGAAESKIPEIKPPPPPPPRRRDEYLPDVPLTPVEISPPMPPVTVVPGPGDAILKTKLAEAKRDAAIVKARLAKAEADAARADAARAVAAGNAVAAEQARTREAGLRRIAAQEAQDARAAAAAADAARKEAEGRAAAEAMQRAKEGAAAAEKARQASARIAQLEDLIRRSREQANTYIRAAQAATGKANTAIRAANDARIAAGKAKTAYEREQARRNVALKGEIARRMKVEAALKRAQAAAANANVKESEARAAIAKAEAAAQDARDAAARAASERDLAMRDAAEREARLKEQLAITEAQKADAAQRAASNAKQQATQAAETARQEQAAPPLPTTPLPPAPLPPGASEVSPEALEGKRQMVARAFHDATSAHEGYMASVEEAGRYQRIDPFWLLDDLQIDKQLGDVIYDTEKAIPPAPLIKERPSGQPGKPRPTTAQPKPRPAPPVDRRGISKTEMDLKKAIVDGGLLQLVTYANNSFRSRLKKSYPLSFAVKLKKSYQDVILGSEVKLERGIRVNVVPPDDPSYRITSRTLDLLDPESVRLRVLRAVSQLRKYIDWQTDFYALPVGAFAAKYGVPKTGLAMLQAEKDKGFPAEGVPVAGESFAGAAVLTRKQKAMRYVANLYRKAGVPLAKPDPRVSFWRQPAAAIAAKLEAIKQAVPKPIAAPARRVTGADLERKRQKVAAAFQSAVRTRKAALLARRRKEPEKVTLRAVAIQFARRKIPLGRPPVISGSLHAPIAIYGRPLRRAA